MLAEGVIRPSSSNYASPVTLVPKKDGSTLFCVDYRRLNDITIKDQYPLPLIQDIFDHLGGSTIFSTIDLKSGYWQIPVAEEHIHKTAFRCHRGLFEFTKMPFGLANAPAIFQRVMDKVLASYIGKFALVYLDDIVIYSRNKDEHLDHIQAVFDKIYEAGLRLKPQKCVFGLKEVKLLGYVVSGDGIRADEAKSQAIADLKPPTTIKGVRSFLGMTGYYRQCMPDYARVAEPLLELTRNNNNKNSRFKWGEAQDKSFQKLKDLLTSSHVMAAPDTQRPYKLYTDACNYAVGAILVQEDKEGIERVVQYVSHSLSSTQRRWAVIEKEAYAVVYALKKLRAYLYESDFVVYTDHRPLKCLFTKDMNNTKIQRWAVLLAEYGARIEYRKGKHNIRAGMLSRIDSSGEVAVIDTGEWVNPALIPDQRPEDILPLLHDGLDLHVIAQEQEVEFPTQWQRGQDEEDESYTLINGVLYSIEPPSHLDPAYPRLVLPKAHQSAVIDRAHREVGHMATWKTLRRITEAYVWPGM
jgi:IS1 family transposase